MTKKEEPTGSNSAIVEPPQTADDFCRRGWYRYARQEFNAAVDDFNSALQSNPQNPDILYALGLTLQAAGQGDKAVNAFEQVLKSLSTLQDTTRASMLSRMTRGHINRIRTGDWKMDSEELL